MSSDVTEEIMDGTYRALCEHGYAEVTVQDIADETDKTTGTLHYHYGSKRDLLVAFLEYLYEEFTAQVGDPDGETPTERLEAFLDAVLTPPEDDDYDHEAFGTAILELKAQAPYDEGVRQRLRAFDEFLFERIRTYVAEGIETGEFRAVDPEATARFLVTAIDGARTKNVAVGQDLARTRRMLRNYVETHLVAEAAEGTDANDRSDASGEDGDANADDGRVIPE